MNIDQLNQLYEELIRPSILLDNVDEVHLFLKDATKEDLLAFEAACVKDEAYEYAQIARDLLNNIE